MDAHAVSMVNEHMDRFRQEATQRRALQPDHRNLAQWLASAVASLRSVTRTPKLDEHPYRS